jgi:hypothetical protein
MRVVVEVITIGGGLPGSLGASCSASVASMSVDPFGAKKLRAFGGSLTAADVGTCLVDFFAVCDVLLCLLCLFTFWKSSSWAADSSASLHPSCALTLRTAFSSFYVTVHMT